MKKELQKELALAQQKLKAIDKLSNVMQEVKSKQKNEVAYFIHRIIEANEWSSEEARELLAWQLEGKKDIFMDA